MIDVARRTHVNRIARIAAVLVVSLGGIAACHYEKPLTDAQLTRLLRSERAAPADAEAPLDFAAVDCLRAWSGDGELARTPAPIATSEAAKASCKQRIDGWIQDAVRNPDHLVFDDISTPAVVKRVVALQSQHRPSAAAPMAGDRPPAAMMQHAAPTPPPSPAAMAALNHPVDLDTATSGIDELAGLCQQAKDAKASKTASPLANYATTCDDRIQRLRDRAAELASNGGNSREVEMLNDNIRRLLVAGRRLAAANKADAAH
jgi:hypothetical protein